MKKKPTVWLARDNGDWKCYALSAGRELRYDKEDGIWTANNRWGQSEAVSLCPTFVEKVAPKSCHLPPGGGPVKIDITIRRAKKK
jgi:hypothetical protein